MSTLPLSIRKAIDDAYMLLPDVMDSKESDVMLLSIGGQESGFEHRWQVINPKHPEKKGPARSFWQFELGSQDSRGGVWGVYLHDASRYWLSKLCKARSVEFSPKAIWLAIEQDDVLAAGLARLLLFTDPKALPAVGDVEAAWRYYLRTWRPGAYTRGTPKQRAALRAKWNRNYAVAVEAVQ